ncbi:hypothetical protein BH09BAC1_BH09BAC1_06300 [soil metagenome]
METYNPGPFRSFWQGGFECADHLNCFGNRVDMLHITGHDVCVAEDYKALQQLGIFTAREGIRWSHVERVPGQYDWAEVKNRIQVAQELGMQQIWDLCHFGYPDYLSPLHPHFSGRFTDMCRAFAWLWKEISTERLMVIPINEMSFISWLGGDVRGTVPYTFHNGFEVKYRLAAAAIQGIKAIKEILPDALVLSSEPLIHVWPQCGRIGTPHDVRGLREAQFQAMDMVFGHICPELGGSRDLIDIIGFNFYYDNQWRHCEGRTCWETDRGGAWAKPSRLLMKAYRRYNKPFFISETSHLGTGRGEWLEYMAQECQTVINRGGDLRGVCLYPILDRPDWDYLHLWHNSGMWDMMQHENQPPKRILCNHYAQALHKVRSSLHAKGSKQPHQPTITINQINAYQLP